MDKPEYSLREPEKADSIPQEKPSKAVESTPKTEKTEKVEAADVPMAVDYFSIKGWPEMLLTPALDYGSMVTKVSSIESFIKSHLDFEGLVLNEKNYSSAVRSLEDYLGLSNDHQPSLRVGKIYNLIRMMERFQTAAEKKSAIFNLINNHI